MFLFAQESQLLYQHTLRVLLHGSKIIATVRRAVSSLPASTTPLSNSYIHASLQLAGCGHLQTWTVFTLRQRERGLERFLMPLLHFSETSPLKFSSFGKPKQMRTLL